MANSYLISWGVPPQVNLLLIYGKQHLLQFCNEGVGGFHFPSNLFSLSGSLW